MAYKKLQKLFVEFVNQQNLWVLFVLGFLILSSRFFVINNSPELINQDELNNIYDAWSYSQTASDRHSTPSPFYLHGLGNEDQRPSLQAWALTPIFIYSSFSVEKARIIAVCIGFLTAFLFYFAVYFQKGLRFANISFFLLSICPWFFTFIGLAHEGANIHLFSASLVLFFISWAISKKWFFPLSAASGMALGLATNAYQASKLWSLLIFICCIFYLFLTKKSIKKIAIFIFFTFIFTLPQFYLLINNSTSFFSRASSQSIDFSWTWSYFEQIINNFIINLSPKYLISTSYNNLSSARLGWFLFFLSLAGCLLFFIKEDKKTKLFIGLISISFLMPSVLTFNNPHALRSAPLLFIYIFWAAYLYNWILEKFTKINKLQILVFSLLGLFSFSFWFFSENKKSLDKKDMMTETVGSVLAFKEIAAEEFKDSSKLIYYETETFEIDLYLAAFFPIHPIDFKKMYKKYEVYNWDRCIQFSNTYFLSRKDMNTISFDSISKKEIYLFSDSLPARFKKIKTNGAYFLGKLEN